MIVPKSEFPRHPIVIDLEGPDGNAQHLLAYANRFSKQMGNSKERTEEILDEMVSSDYKNLLKVFDREFGSFVTLLTPQ